MFKLSSDDANSTQLEGKKLKNRRVRFGEFYNNETEDSSSLGQDVDLQRGQEFFTDLDIDVEKELDEKEEEKRKNKTAAMLAATKQKSAIHKTKTKLDKEQDMDFELTEEEAGVEIDQKKESEHIRDSAITKLEATKPERTAAQDGATERKNDMPAAKFLLGDNAAKLDFKSEVAEAAGKQPSGILDSVLDVSSAATEAVMVNAASVKPTELPDIRGREATIQI